MPAEEFCQGDRNARVAGASQPAHPPCSVPHASHGPPCWQGLGGPAWVLGPALLSPICTRPGWVRGEGLTWLLPPPPPILM